MNEQEAQTKENMEMPAITPELLEKYLKSFRECRLKQQRTYNLISGIRLLVFLVLVIGLLIALAARLWWGWLLAGMAALVFGGAILYHTEIGDHQDYLDRLIRVYEGYHKRFCGEWQGFSETGQEFGEESDYVSADLDVFGSDSLYQLLCVAHTDRGRQRLAEVLKQREEPIEAIRRRQEAVAELAKKNRFSLHYEALAMNCEKDGGKQEENTDEDTKEDTDEQATVGTESRRTESGRTEGNSKNVKFSMVLRFLAWAYPILFLLCIVGVVLHWWNSGLILVLFFGALFFSWCMSGYCQRKVGNMFRHARVMQTYLYMMEALAVEEWDASYLKELQERITGGEEKEENLLVGLKKLNRLLAAYNIRYNPMVHWLLSGICFYDFHLAGQAVRWEQRYGECLKQGILALGEVEMLSSLAVLERVNKKVTYPEFVESDLPEFRMEQVFHPLLAGSVAVANDISLRGQSVIITGSNMSGKTTFLRTVGLNLILAYAGAPVCGTAVRLSWMRIFTSMRVTDDVRHGISTFYAEILRIKEMVEYEKQRRPMLCLVDEIFKGTNSADRIVGAEAVIRKLSNDTTILMVSTHDFELCKLADNYHFEEYYEDDKICFDYHLKKGICTTTNALYLLKMAGLTETGKN